MPCAAAVIFIFLSFFFLSRSPGLRVEVIHVVCWIMLTSGGHLMNCNCKNYCHGIKIKINETFRFFCLFILAE